MTGHIGQNGCPGYTKFGPPGYTGTEEYVGVSAIFGRHFTRHSWGLAGYSSPRSDGYRTVEPEVMLPLLRLRDQELLSPALVEDRRASPIGRNPIIPEVLSWLACGVTALRLPLRPARLSEKPSSLRMVCEVLVVVVPQLRSRAGASPQGICDRAGGKAGGDHRKTWRMRIQRLPGT